MKNIPYILLAGLIVWFVITISGDWKKSDAYQEGWQLETERISGMIDSFKSDKGRYPTNLLELLPDYYTPSELFPSEEGKHLEYFEYSASSNSFELNRTE